VRALEGEGVRALNPSMGFPMEMDRFPGRIWVGAHKIVAEAAGLGRIGIHRNVIHPRFGNFVLLGTLLIDREVSEEGQVLEENPCLECKLCVAACPTGAIKSDGAFDFAACYTHNYREFMSGFTNWVENVADSRDARDYRARVTDAESASMWQSLGFGPNYKAAYCLSVCPAGEDVIGPYREDKRAHLREVVKPLQEKIEDIYVVPDSDAEAHVEKRFPHKTVRRVRSGLRPTSIAGFLEALPNLFQRGKAADLEATYHFRFSGSEQREATVVIRKGSLRVEDGLVGDADLVVRADADSWVGFLREERGLVGALLRRRIRLRGSPKLLLAFARCFPS
jgi:Fe-S-cluster-containing hydrogenase component 2